MKVEYSPDENLLYLQLQLGVVADTIEIGPDIFVDLDGEGAPLGIEFLDAADFLPFTARHDGRLDAETLRPLAHAGRD
jgi:uncharacterized protein YuzE